MHRIASFLFLGLCLSAAAAGPVPTPSDQPIGADVLSWTQPQRAARFGHMEQVYPVHRVRAGGHPRPLPAGPRLDPRIAWRGTVMTPRQFMAAQNMAGLLVLDHGRVRIEAYGLQADRATRWTSFSMAKSVTSTLIGAAIREHAIASVDDPVIRYLPELRGSAYDGVTLRQVLTMTSGVAWNEDYSDPRSDVAALFRTRMRGGLDPTLAYMRRLGRAHPPGTTWHYNTGETGLAGLIAVRARGRGLAAQLSDTIWGPYGMAADALWGVGPGDVEPGGCCLSATLRDWGRFGQFMLDGGKIRGRAVLPDGWIKTATTARASIDVPGRGYGYQWWTLDDGAYEAIGIFGQAMHIDPARQLVVVMLGAWPSAVGEDMIAGRHALFDAVTRAVDRERHS